jgi:hypothetical protein
VHARYHSGELRYNISNSSSRRSHRASGRASRTAWHSRQKATPISYCNRHVRRRWATVSRTRPSGCWRGYTRSSSSGQTLTLGQTKKVRALIPKVDFVGGSFLRRLIGLVLTWISIFWFSRAGPAASVRIYFEIMGSGDAMNLQMQDVKVPVGVSYFPKETGQAPRAFVHFFSFLCFVRGSRLRAMTHCVGSFAPNRLLCSSRNMLLVATLRRMKNRKLLWMI